MAVSIETRPQLPLTLVAGAPRRGRIDRRKLRQTPLALLFLARHEGGVHARQHDVAIDEALRDVLT